MPRRGGTPWRLDDSVLGARPSFGRWIPRLGVGLAAAVVFLLLARSVALLIAHDWAHIRFPYPVDYGEGPILDQVQRLAHFTGIYRPSLTPAPFTASNYPPLYPLVQVPFYWLFGPAYWYGRTISFVSTLAAALFIGLTLHRLTEDRLASVIGGTILLAFPFVLTWSAYGRVDSLALGLSWAGLFAVVRWSESRRGLALSAALFVAAMFTRQSYALAAPFAAFVWLLSGAPRRRAFVLAAWIVGLTLSVFLALQAITRGGFYFNIVTLNINRFEWATVYGYAEAICWRASCLVAGSVFFLLLGLRYRTPLWWLATPYLIGAVIDGLTVGKIGSSVNYMFEPCAAFSLVAGAIVALAGSRWRVKTVLLLLLAAQAHALYVWTNPEYSTWTTRRITDRRADLDLMFDWVRNAKGPVLADEFVGLLPLAGKPIYFQPFEMNEMAADGAWDQTPLVDAIARKEFPLILIYEGRWPHHWTREQRAAIRASYVRTPSLAETAVFIPRR